MLGWHYLKVPATTWAMQFKGGRLVREGAGLAFWYFAPACVIAEVPVSSADQPFAFRETTADFQDVTVQGAITYRVSAPRDLATLLNYTVDTRGRYVSDDPQKLGERVVQSSQSGARRFLQGRPLREALTSSAELAAAIEQTLRQSATVLQLGVEVLEVSVASIGADPEMTKALQADAREALMREADEAMAERRNLAVQLERSIRENELRTERVVAERTREVRETELAGEIATEEQRAALVDRRIENEAKEAEARAKALEATLGPVRDVDWRTLMAVRGGVSPEALIASAFEGLAQNAEKIGTLNVTPDLLESLAGGTAAAEAPARPRKK